MPLEIRELTIRAIVEEPGESSPGFRESAPSENHFGERGGKVDEQRIIELATEQVMKLLKDKDER